MPQKVIMPQLGESVVEGTITRWLKTPGEPVEEYEPLLEVNTDKVDSEIPSPFSGTLLEILVPEGTTVQAGEVLAVIGEEGEAAAAEETAGEGRASESQAVTLPLEVSDDTMPLAVEAEQEQSPTQEQRTRQEAQAPATEQRAGEVRPAEQPTQEVGRSMGFISPVVGRMASEHNIDLTRVEGTGLGGRITKKDVLTYIERMEAGELPPAPAEAPFREASPAASAPVPAPTGRAGPPAKPPDSEAGPGQVLPHNTVRRAIADHMVMSKRTSPHVTTIMEADLLHVVEHRQENKDAFSRNGVNLTFTAYFVAAVVAALKEYPLVNSSWSDEGIILHREINIGMATSLGEQGLIVPVLKNADELSLLGIARAVNDLANRARSRKLQPDEVKGGTFTITNHGTSGSLFATPIINQPQCGILGVGAIQKRVVVTSGDAIAIRPMAYLSLTFDHRILDGAVADYFLGRVVKSLENWG